jgi:uncharacterized membrane protein
MFLLLSSLIGSYFNIPLFEIAGQTVSGAQVVQFFGMHYQVPAASGHAGTIVPANVGGAVIPGCMSFYLLWHYNLWLKAIIATAVVAAVCYFLATPVQVVGIALPVFLPAIATAIVALVLDFRLLLPGSIDCGAA